MQFMIEGHIGSPDYEWLSEAGGCGCVVKYNINLAYTHCLARYLQFVGGQEYSV